MSRLTLIISVIGLACLFPTPGSAQQHPGSLELGPFHYRMHIDEVRKSGFQVIHDEVEEDGTLIVGLLLNEDDGTFAVIQFPPQLMPYAQSIQITGSDRDLPLFDGIRLGMSKRDLFETLGEPSDSTVFAEEDITLFQYDQGNYSVEIHGEFGLRSIMILGDGSILRHLGFSDNWLNYEPMQMDYVIEMYAPPADRRPYLLFNSSPFRPRVVFTGRSRPTPSSSKSLFQTLLQGRRLDTDIAETYTIEIEVSDNGTSYWLMMDGSMLPDLVSATDNGARPVDLFAMLIGFDKDGPVLICNEFVTF